MGMVLCASNAEEGYQKLHIAQIAYIANVVNCFVTSPADSSECSHASEADSL